VGELKHSHCPTGLLAFFVGATLRRGMGGDRGEAEGAEGRIVLPN